MELPDPTQWQVPVLRLSRNALYYRPCTDSTKKGLSKEGSNPNRWKDDGLQSRIEASTLRRKASIVARHLVTSLRTSHRFVVAIACELGLDVDRETNACRETNAGESAVVHCSLFLLFQMIDDFRLCLILSTTVLRQDCFLARREWQKVPPTLLLQQSAEQELNRAEQLT